MNVLVVGFTGTQRGMAARQAGTARALLGTLMAMSREVEFHHGDCTGADDEADDLAYELGAQIVLHPPTDGSRRAFKLRPTTRVLRPRPYLARNLDIATVCDVMIAAPAQREEQVRSGTWSTYRAARRLGRVTFLLYPDGSIDGRDMALGLSMAEIRAMVRQGRLM